MCSSISLELLRGQHCNHIFKCFQHFAGTNNNKIQQNFRDEPVKLMATPLIYFLIIPYFMGRGFEGPSYVFEHDHNDNTYLIPFNFRAPFIFAPLIFAYPRNFIFRAPVIFAHQILFAPLLFSIVRPFRPFSCKKTKTRSLLS